ncbi:putative Tetratricopeptide repeat-containing protein [Flavobacterium sp. 9AF]|nr:putative Tetratricopeptide repeat-containing protein [Flavobacterium sp. 9AF]
MKSFLIAKKHFEKKKDYYNLAKIQVNLGNIQASQNKYREAIPYFKKALEFSKLSSKPYSILHEYTNIGKCYDFLKEYDKAIEYLEKALIICEKEGNEKENKIYVLKSLGNVYSNLKNIDKALFYYNQALEINKSHKSKSDDIRITKYIGNAYMSIDNYSKAIPYYEKALKKVNDQKDIVSLYELSYNLSKAYEFTGNYKKAQFHMENFAKAKDSANEMSNLAAIKKIESNFEIERNDSKLKLLEKEKKAINASLKRKNIIILSILSFILLSIIFFYLLYKQERKIFKSKLHLNDAESNLKGQFIERKRIAQELHDNIGSSLAAVRFSVMDAMKDTSEEKNKLLTYIDSICNEVRFISHNIMPPDITEQSLQSLLEQLVENYKLNSSLHFEIYFTDEQKLEKLSNQQKLMLYRVVQESINNAIKHSKCKNINILISCFDNYVNIIIEDDGIGFDTKNTQYGLGIKSIKERCKEFNIDLDLDSEPNKGTTITFNIFYYNE